MLRPCSKSVEWSLHTLIISFTTLIHITDVNSASQFQENVCWTVGIRHRLCACAGCGAHGASCLSNILCLYLALALLTSLVRLLCTWLEVCLPSLEHTSLDLARAATWQMESPILPGLLVILRCLFALAPLSSGLAGMTLT